MNDDALPKGDDLIGVLRTRIEQRLAERGRIDTDLHALRAQLAHATGEPEAPDNGAFRAYAQACGDPGSITPREPGESVSRWSARACLILEGRHTDHLLARAEQAEDTVARVAALADEWEQSLPELREQGRASGNLSYANCTAMDLESLRALLPARTVERKG